MPAGNPFAPMIEVGGGASVGPVSGNLSGTLGSAGDNHASAAFVLLSLALLFLLWKGRFRFSTKVG